MHVSRTHSHSFAMLLFRFRARRKRMTCTHDLRHRMLSGPAVRARAGGNTWAGGTGGRDTAGLGGKGGPYRLSGSQPIHQVSEEEKVRIGAWEAARLRFRLSELGLLDEKHEPRLAGCSLHLLVQRAPLPHLKSFPCWLVSLVRRACCADWLDILHGLPASTVPMIGRTHKTQVARVAHAACSVESLLVLACLRG
eukprot:6196870-Pleurochrysis_carterae.AAC.3